MQNGVVDCHLCPECGRGFKKRSKLIIHIRRHTGEKPYTCDVCGKSFIDNSALTCHKKIHSGEKPHTCNICKRCFTNKCTLKRHILRHIGEKNYICKICNNGYTTDSDLTSHVKWHSAENSFVCDVCGKGFLLKSALNKHISTVHLKNKPHACLVCEKRFAQRCNLVKHLKTHENPHTCTICTKTFTLEKYLVKHLKRHTEGSNTNPEGVKKFPIENKPEGSLAYGEIHPLQETHVCKICDKKLKSKGYLIRHMKSHEQTLFECSPRHKTFQSESRVKTHATIHGSKQFIDCSSDVISLKGHTYIKEEPDLKSFEITVVKEEVVDLDPKVHQEPESLEIWKEEKQSSVVEDIECKNSDIVLGSFTACAESVDDFVNCDIESKHRNGSVHETDIDPLI